MEFLKSLILGFLVLKALFNNPLIVCKNVLFSTTNHYKKTSQRSTKTFHIILLRAFTKNLHFLNSKMLEILPLKPKQNIQ